MTRHNTPITDDAKKRVLKLHAQGKARNEIARETGISSGSVTNIVHAAGGSFERTATAAPAFKARQEDLRLRRATLLERVTAHAEKTMDRIEQPTHTAILKTSGGGEREEQVEVLPTREARDLTQVMLTYVRAMESFARMDSGGEAETAKSMLSGVQAQLQAYATEGEPESKTEEPKEAR